MDYFYLLFKEIQIDSFETPWAIFLVFTPFVYIAICILLRSRLFRRIVLPSIMHPDNIERELSNQAPHLIRVNFKRLVNSSRAWSFLMSGVILMGGLLCIAMAIAHPYGGASNETRTEGIDIYFSLDMSASMKAYDYSLDEMQASYMMNVAKPNRFEVAKSTIRNFVNTRKERCHDHTSAIARCDRIGMVLFGQMAFVDIPLTIDYEALSNHIKARRIDDIDASQSAIGDGILSAVASLRHSDSKSKNIILVSDGDRKGGRISMEQAVSAAKKYGVRVFPILIGNSDTAVLAQTNAEGYVTFHEAQFPVNFELLKGIAEQTGGQAYRVSNDRDFQLSLNSVLEQLEPHVSIDTRRELQIDLSRHFIFISFLLFMMAFVIFHLFGRRYP